MRRISIPSRTIRILCAAGFVAATVMFAQSQDVLRDITRPIVLGIMNFLGAHAEDRGENMVIGRLEVPWTRDCAGMNLLLIMLGLAVWVNREEPGVMKFWLRVAAMVPAAIAANVLRVLSLIGYRMIAYPAVESPQTHYFLGFIWMVPFITLITPRAGRPVSHALLETLHAAAVIALLTPMTGMPNGTLIAVAVVLALSQCQVRETMWKRRLALSALWLGAGATVAAMNMESFWLPWLLCCPLLLDIRWLFSPQGILVMLSTHSMFAMHPWAAPAGWLGVGLAIWTWLGKSDLPESTDVTAPAKPAAFTRHALAFGSALCLLVPFLSSTLLSIGHQGWQPPAALQSRPLDGKGYEVLVPGQPGNIALVCYGAEGKDRHHTVKVCLKYRGTELAASNEVPAVYTDGKHWLREFFLQDGKLLADYPAYLGSTFKPGSDPGVHLIFISPMGSGTPQSFAASSAGLADSFHQLCVNGGAQP